MSEKKTVANKKDAIQKLVHFTHPPIGFPILPSFLTQLPYFSNIIPSAMQSSKKWLIDAAPKDKKSKKAMSVIVIIRSAL